MCVTSLSFFLSNRNRSCLTQNCLIIFNINLNLKVTLVIYTIIP